MKISRYWLSNFFVPSIFLTKCILEWMLSSFVLFRHIFYPLKPKMLLTNIYSNKITCYHGRLICPEYRIEMLIYSLSNVVNSTKIQYMLLYFALIYTVEPWILFFCFCLFQWHLTNLYLWFCILQLPQTEMQERSNTFEKI